MFCMNCGAKMLQHDDFCGSCGEQGATTATKPGSRQTTKPAKSKKGTGNLIVSGKGAFKSKSIISHLIMIVVNIVMAWWVLSFSQSRLDSLPRLAGASQRQTIQNIQVLIVIYMIVVSIYLLFRIHQTTKATATHISVCDDAVKGCFIAGEGIMGALEISIQEVVLSYDMIVNVDAIKAGTKIIVHAQHAKYICYSKNGDEIRNAIMERVNMQKSGGAKR